MPEVLVIDSSALVNYLSDDGPAGTWVGNAIRGRRLAAPDLVLYETANVFRRLSRTGVLTEPEARTAHADLMKLSLELWPYRILSRRAWELRASLTVFDASFVAVAELVGGPLITLDARLSRAHGPLCPVVAFDPTLKPGQWRSPREGPQ